MSTKELTLRTRKNINVMYLFNFLALLLSGAMVKGIEWSPYSVKKAVEKSAMFLSDVEPIAQGCGLIQVKNDEKIGFLFSVFVHWILLCSFLFIV